MAAAPNISKKVIQPMHPVTLVPGDFDFASKIDDALGQPDQDRTAFKIYDKAILNWIKKRFSMDGSTLPVIPSNPQNAFADYRKMLEVLGHDFCKTDTRKYEAYPLPMVSINSVGHDVRAGAIVGYPIRGIAFFDNIRGSGTLNRGAAYTRYPKPIMITYSISLWALLRTHLAWMVQRLEMAFWNKMATFRVAHAPFEHLRKVEYVTSIHRESYEEVTESTRDERSERLLRGVFRIKVEAWMWDDLMHAPTVLKEGRDFVDQATGDTLFTQLLPLTPDAPVRSTPTTEPGVEI